MKCLIVDDDEFSRGFVAALLEGLAECGEASSGREGVAKFNEALECGAPYDLIIQDIVMPEMDGHEAARAIRSMEREYGVPAGKGVKIVMLTALNSPQDVMESFYSVQSAAYIVKPVTREKLVDIISKLGLSK